MSRGARKISKEAPKGDPRFGNPMLAKFTNYVMMGGKKTIAQTIVYSALEKASIDAKKTPVQIFDDAIRNVQPQVEVRSRRVGGANYQVPMPVRGERQNALAFRWIIDAARAKKGQPMYLRLATVFLDAFNNTGDAVRKRDDMHRMAEANKAFAHFARFSK